LSYPSRHRFGGSEHSTPRARVPLTPGAEYPLSQPPSPHRTARSYHTRAHTHTHAPLFFRSALAESDLQLLPAELISLTFQFLDVASLCRLSLVALAFTAASSHTLIHLPYTLSLAGRRYVATSEVLPTVSHGNDTSQHTSVLHPPLSLSPLVTHSVSL
jgi:hypothetical protein